MRCLTKINRQAVSLVITGTGLIIAGVAAWFLLTNPVQDDPTQATDFSAIPAKVEYQAPAITLSDIKGNRHSLSDFQGSVVLVNLWATWCPPCKAEMPLFQDYYLKHRGEGFIVIAIEDGDPASDVITFMNKYDLTYPIWLDPTYQATDQVFKTKNLPSSYAIDRAGNVKLAWVGAINAANLEKYITPLIKE